MPRIWNIPSSNTSRETACLVWCFLWVCLVSPGKCRNDDARLIHNCFHPTVTMFTFRTRFLFSVSLNNGKIELACPQMMWDRGRYFQSEYCIWICSLLQRYCLTTGVGGTCCLHLPACESEKRRKLRAIMRTFNCVSRGVELMFIALKVKDFRQGVGLKRWKQVCRDGWEHWTRTILISYVPCTTFYTILLFALSWTAVLRHLDCSSLKMALIKIETRWSKNWRCAWSNTV